MAGLADVIAGVVGGLGGIGLQISAQNQQTRERAMQTEEQSGLARMFGNQQIENLKSQQLADTAATVLSQQKAAQQAADAAKKKQTTILVISIVGGTVLFAGVIAVIYVKSRKPAA